MEENKEKEEKQEIIEVKKDGSEYTLKLSASRVKTYMSCPRKYYYNYIEKLPRKEWPHFKLGHLAHGTLERFHSYFKHDNLRSSFDLRELLKQSLKKEFDAMRARGDIVSRDILLEAKSLLKDYLDFIMKNGLEGNSIIGLETEFEVGLRDKEISVGGFIDRYDIDKNGIYHIKDYKTNKNLKYMDPFQLSIYGIYLNEKYGIEEFKGSYIMLRHKSKLLTYDFNLSDIEKAKKKLIKQADLIMTDERWKACPTQLCNWCDFQEQCYSSWV
jgi:CRISPR/Cas system-associated exonuclease Cas4 (RecB family)